MGTGPGVAGHHLADGQCLLCPVAVVVGGARPGADTKTAATVALVVAVVLLLVQGWAGGKASQLRGLRLLAVTLIAGAFGVAMILLKLLITH
jgi:hypothetical protein